MIQWSTQALIRLNFLFKHYYSNTSAIVSFQFSFFVFRIFMRREIIKIIIDVLRIQLFILQERAIWILTVLISNFDSLS